ncbi:hypothetical protein [Mycoplasmopsis arginini]|uniref:hypothetical protein n=2 Tax=Mycoplasmopsis arginini TaxID=2094 RepID=UPI00227AC24D|nr:hypothetical protein [Mycoplasmopsis arginini]MCY2903071.1 hypothetical protein [Mycoplasmopsis arginini QMP CG1-2758]MDI3348570.1 hypothetical protein [Mycoplasmopsis arginini]MDI3348628.1 hypothetical protein [Mycoplasmopsis arginini]MDI3351071.1 hypothetical protein [Mycoplasmopsis arginini]MDI3352744.1 hypothetical protein [Mycoplasmopsis arginini]
MWWKILTGFLLITLIFLGVILFLFFENKIKIKLINKVLLKIEIYLKKLNKINDQFYELSKKNLQYKKFEKDCAKDIMSIESIYSNLLVEYKKITFIFETKNFRKTDFNNCYIKIRKYLKSIKAKVKSSRKWSIIESEKAVDVLNFINKKNNVINQIEKIIKTNQNNGFIELNKEEINKRKQMIIFLLKKFDYLDLSLLNNSKLATKKEEFNKELKFFILYIENGLSIFNFIEKNIEIPFSFLNDLYYKYRQMYSNVFQDIFKNNFLDHIKNKIDSLKKNLDKNNILEWKEIYKTKLLFLAKEIYEKYQQVNNELESIFKLTENQEKILEILNKIDNNHRELLKINNVQDQYIKLSNIFYNNEYVYFNFIKTKDLDKITNVSFYNKLNELYYLLNKAKEILKIQNSLLKKKDSINSNNFKKEISNKYLQAFSFHDFNYEIDKEIIKYQKKYLSFVEANNFEDQEFLLLLIKNIKTKILLLNLKIKIANYLVKNFNFLTKNLYHKENIEIINFFYQKKYDEVIHKTIELITKNKRK